MYIVEPVRGRSAKSSQYGSRQNENKMYAKKPTIANGIAIRAFKVILFILYTKLYKSLLFFCIESEIPPDSIVFTILSIPSTLLTKKEDDRVKIATETDIRVVDSAWRTVRYVQ